MLESTIDYGQADYITKITLPDIFTFKIIYISVILQYPSILLQKYLLTTNYILITV